MQPITLTIIVLTAISTYYALSNSAVFNRYSLHIGPIRKYNQFDRFFSSGFLHVDWTHFAFNMYTFYIFSTGLEVLMGKGQFILLYFGSMLAGSALAYYFHKNENHYKAVGASGAVMGIVFAYIMFFPNATFLLFFILPMPAWLVGLLYIGYSIYGMEKKNDNIGHDAHLGGAIGGLLIFALLEPEIIMKNATTAILIITPIVVYAIYKFGGAGVEQLKKRDEVFFNIDDEFNSKKVNQKKELDALLEKISKYGLESLSLSEKERLEELSK